MADIGIGQRQTAFLRYRFKEAADALSDNHFLMSVLKKSDGILRISGGRTILDEALSGTNSTVGWGGEKHVVSQADDKVLDSPEFPWCYLYGSVSMSMAEQLMNEGDGRSIPLLVKKSKALEITAMNKFHEGLNSSGTADNGLQLDGIPAHISTTPTSGTRGTIDTSQTDAAWFRTQKFDADNDWTDGAVSSANAKRFFDKLIDSTTRDSKCMLDALVAGQGTNGHWEAATQAIQGHQTIVNVDDTGKVGFEKMIYRGVPIFMGGGINFSGYTPITATRTYGLCCKEGGFNLVFHKKAEFEILPPVNAQDQTAFSRLLFTMCATITGGLSKFCTVGFNA